LAGRASLYLGRQPILDRRQELVAFELLFRSGTGNAAVFSDDVRATATVIANAFNELGVESVLGPYRGFINLSEALILSDIVEVLPRDKVVLEVLETVRPTPEIAARCAELRAMGFSLALDDVISADAAFAPLLPSVEIIKIDVKQVKPASLPHIVQHFKASGLALLAEKVDSRQEVEACLALGFDYLQGYYFSKPEIISGKKLAPSEQTLLTLLGLILSDAEHGAIEEALKRDAALSINLLRLANSAASGLRQRAATITSAIMLLGRRQLQRWLQLLLYAGEPGHNVPTPLMQLAATRGRMMELLAPHTLAEAERELAFTTGVMSLMDTVLKRPLAEIVASLPVGAEMKSALLDRGGPLGALLTLCERLEEGDPPRVDAALRAFPRIAPRLVNLAQADALRWANALGEQVG
jgi:EAL and modified HD-GYP domain-containing signal transduction protein